MDKNYVLIESLEKERLPTPAKSQTSVLILLTYSQYNENTPPVITDTLGTVKYGGVDFEFETESETEVHNSCSVTFKGKSYVFGGTSMKTQISQINNCQLKRVGSLSFEFSFGACTNVNDSELYLCFDQSNTQTCRKSSNQFGPFTTISDSISTHYKTRIANDGGKLWFKNY